MREKLSIRLKSGIKMVSDGAWGTFLYKKGLGVGECPELWNITHRKEVLEVAQSYIQVGAQMIETNSFGGTSLKLASFGLQDRVFELNKAAAEISREAAGDSNYVLGSVGPTGKFLVTEDITKDELYNSFKEQMIALEAGGSDAICIETFFDLDEAKYAVKAAKENTNLEVICTFTFDKQMDGSYKTMMGVSPTVMVNSLVEFGVDIIGTNCGNGFEGMIDIVREIRSVNKDIPIIVQANAGLPYLENGVSEYPETPEFVANAIPKLLDAGANCIGGCCGTTPDHIKSIVEVINRDN